MSEEELCSNFKSTCFSTALKYQLFFKLLIHSIEMINNSTLLSGVKLGYEIYDTCTDVTVQWQLLWGLSKFNSPREIVEFKFNYSSYVSRVKAVISSVHFSHSVVSDSSWPHESQHARPPCASATPRVYSNSCPSSWWCHPTISSSVVPFSSCLQSHPASGSFPMSQLFAWGGQVLEFQLQHQSFQWTPRTDLLSDGLLGFPCSPRDSQESSPNHSSKASISWRSAFLTVQLSHPYMTTGKTIALTRQISVGKVMSLLFNMLSRLFITFLPRSKQLLISWLQSPSAVILQPPPPK